MKIKINKENLISVLLFAVVCEFPIFERLSSSLGTILGIIRLIAFAYSILIIVSIKGFKKSRIFNEFHFYFFLFCIIGIVSTIIKTPNQTIYYIIHYLYPYICTLVIFEVILGYGNFNKKISAISKYLSFAVWLNFITMIIWRKGIIVSSASSMHERANWIFGSKNNIVAFLPLVLCIIGMDLSLNKQKKKHILFNYLMLGITFISFSSMGSSEFQLMSGSTTAIFEMLFFLFLFFISEYIQNTKIVRLFTMRNICIFSIILMIIIVDISQGSDGIISKIVVLFGKDIGFTGRYSVWTSAIDAIKESPIFGIGMEERIFRTWNSSLSENTSIYSYWLSIGVRFGILGIIANFAMFATSDKNGNIKDPINFMCKLSFFILMMGGLTSTISIKYWMMILMITYMWNSYGYGNNKAYIEKYYTVQNKK